MPVSFLDVGAAIGPYRVTAWLGSGGMGEVYRAHDPRLNRMVAIKILPNSHVDHARRRRRFETEQHALAALNHPNIVAVYDAGYQDDRPFIVTECLDGQTLRDTLEAPLSIAAVLDYAAQIARGLGAAHARGILHRDLKPENVFVTVDGHIKLLDFGLARLADGDDTVTETSTSDQVEGVAMGTVGYMSPEQALGTAIDHRSDIFAFGIVLFEMLCGRRLFQRLSRIDTLHAIVHDEAPEALDLDPRVPPFVASTLRRCLAKDPAQRFQSAQDLAFALAGERRPPVSKPSRLPRLAAVVTTVVLCGAAGAALLLSRGEAPTPSFKRLTFGRGNHGYARFAPDRTTVVYSAWWNGGGAQMFSTRLDSSESRSLDLADADILSISPTGQMAVLLNPTNAAPSRRVGTLAVVPLAGGAPRALLEDVQGADWSPGGKELAVVRRVADQWRLEYPAGRVLYTAEFIFSPRVSPRGDRVAFIEEKASTATHESVLTRQVCVVDRAGHKATLAKGLPNTVAWSPDGTHIWFADTALHVVDLAGRSRTVISFPEPGWAHVQDVSSDGQVLLVMANYEVGITAHPRGAARERDLSGFGNTEGAALSADGTRLLLGESSYMWTRRPAGVYIRSLDGLPAARLGEGRPLSMSPDGGWALVRVETPPFQLKLYPTGPGEPRPLETGNIEYAGGGAWLPDGRELLIVGRAAGAAARVYALRLDGTPPRPVTPEGVVMLGAVSPDGRYVAALDAARRLTLYRISDGDAVAVPGPPETADLGPWTPDGHAIFVADAAGGTAVHLYKRNIATGARELWRDVEPPDPAGIYGMHLLTTPDGETWAYTYQRFLSNLYAVGGLK